MSAERRRGAAQRQRARSVGAVARFVINQLCGDWLLGPMLEISDLKALLEVTYEAGIIRISLSDP